MKRTVSVVDPRIRLYSDNTDEHFVCREGEREVRRVSLSVLLYLELASSGMERRGLEDLFTEKMLRVSSQEMGGLDSLFDRITAYCEELGWIKWKQMPKS